jgi:small subunit ribosomal protein S18
MAMRKPTRKPMRRIQVPKTCYFCTEKKEPNYADTEVLRRFLTERGKIIGRARSGICAKHQRRLTSAIKHARHLALLPFIVRG